MNLIKEYYLFIFFMKNILIYTYIIQHIFKYESEYKFNKYPGSSGKYTRNKYS